jgi:hypothetical protein
MTAQSDDDNPATAETGQEADLDEWDTETIEAGQRAEFNA